MFIRNPYRKGPKLNGNKRAGAAFALLLALPAAGASAFEKAAFGGGTQMGYTLGQNGFAWPSAKNPLINYNRGGFYLGRLEAVAHLDFDSTFTGDAVANFVTSALEEAWLQKRFGPYAVRAGKFRGAGLKSATGTREMERDAVNAPRYARVWGHYKRLHGFRDYGLEVERGFLSGNLRNRLFVHNANGENVFNDEPSFIAGKATQVLGLDYAVDWRISPYTQWGAHVGALANRSWDEFVGNQEGWKVQHWFGSNPVADASFNHQMDVGRFHLFNEGLVMFLRDMPNPRNGNATRSWGVSSQVRFEHSERWASLFRYEFFDVTDGFVPSDAMHIATLGALWRPSPAAYPGMRLTTEYVRSYEEGLENYYPNDLLLCQFQMAF